MKTTNSAICARNLCRQRIRDKYIARGNYGREAPDRPDPVGGGLRLVVLGGILYAVQPA